MNNLQRPDGLLLPYDATDLDFAGIGLKGTWLFVGRLDAMPRTARACPSGYVYHVWNRGPVGCGCLRNPRTIWRSSRVFPDAKSYVPFSLPFLRPLQSSYVPFSLPFSLP